MADRLKPATTSWAILVRPVLILLAQLTLTFGTPLVVPNTKAPATTTPTNPNLSPRSTSTWTTGLSPSRSRGGGPDLPHPPPGERRSSQPPSSDRPRRVTANRHPSRHAERTT
jgi:hypothetical protein